MIEIMVMLVVAAIILPPLIFPFIEGVRELEIPVISGTLALLAQEEMEKKIIHFFNQTDGYDSIINQGGWTDVPLPNPFTDYSSSCVLDENVSFGEVTEGVVKITLTVTHQDGQSLELVTVKTNWKK